MEKEFCEQWPSSGQAQPWVSEWLRESIHLTSVWLRLAQLSRNVTLLNACKVSWHHCVAGGWEKQHSIDMQTDSVTMRTNHATSLADPCLDDMLTSRGMNTDLPLQLLLSPLQDPHIIHHPVVTATTTTAMNNNKWGSVYHAAGWSLVWKTRKTGNVGEFDSCQGIVREQILSEKTVHCWLHIWGSSYV